MLLSRLASRQRSQPASSRRPVWRGWESCGRSLPPSTSFLLMDGRQTNTALADSPQLIDTAVSLGRNATAAAGGIDRIALTHGKQTKTNFTIMTARSLARSRARASLSSPLFLSHSGGQLLSQFRRLSHRIGRSVCLPPLITLWPSAPLTSIIHGGRVYGKGEDEEGRRR